MDAIDETHETAPGEAAPPAPKQYNKHDVKATETRCQALLQAISGKGAQVDVRGLTRDAGLYALSRLLVQKGIISQDELEGERLALVEQGLQDTLIQVEEQRLQASRPKVQPVRQPGIAVARR